MKEATGGPQVARRVEKPWGYEIVWAETSSYVGKLLHVRAGHELSLQYHERKDETIYVHSGEVVVRHGGSADDLETLAMEAGDVIRLEPGRLHKMMAKTDADLFEASTPELDDLVRIEDRYGRAGTSDP